MMQSQTPLIMAPAVKSQNKGLWLATIIIGAIGMLVWLVATGIPLGFCLDSYYAFPSIGAIILAILNIVYILCTCHIIFIITAVGFPNPGHLRDLRRQVAYLTATILLGFSLNIAAIVMFVIWDDYYYHDTTPFGVVLGCSFSYLWSITVVAIAGVYETRTSKGVASEEAVPLAHHSGIQQIPMTTYPPVPRYYVNPVSSTSYPSFVNQGASTSYPSFVNPGASTSYPHLVGPVPATSHPYPANAAAAPSVPQPATVNDDVSDAAPSESGTHKF